QEVSTLDPAFMWDDFGFALVPATHDTLVAYKKVGGVEGGVVLPNLAEELLPPTDEGRTYSYTLRPGLKYSDGSAVQASDVRRSFERLFLADSTSSVFYGAIKGADGCSPKRCDLSQGIVTENRTRSVVFHLQRAVPDFPYHLAHPMSGLVPPGTAPKDLGITRVPGTGPYAVTTAEGDADSGRAVLERNPHFHSRGAVQPEGYPDRIVVTWGGDPIDRVAAVKAGSEDWTIDAQQEGVDAVRLAIEVPAQLHVFEQQGVFFATLNPNIAPLDDVRVRRAINFAVDRRAMAGHVGAPLLAGVTCQVLAKNLFGYQPYCPYTKDPAPSGTWTAPDLATARRLVRESGTQGQRITIWTPPFEFFERPATVIADALRLLDYRSTVRVIRDFEGFSGLASDAKDFQILLLGWIVDYPAPSSFIMPVLMCPGSFNEFAGLPDASANVANFCSPEIDKMTLRALDVQENDTLRSSDLWTAIDRALTDAAPWVPFATRRVATLVSSRVGNVLFNPTTGPLITQMWLTDRK
ncbi:MAG: ABC transporter substrate-binding protein, partial [Actinomycetota bacterium]